MARPRKPSYTSFQKVIAAIRECSCGKFANWETETSPRLPDLERLAQGMTLRYQCECIGPKSTTELLHITKLHSNTLGRTCKYLVELQVLRRIVQKQKGHHVKYALTRRDPSDVDELIRPEENYQRVQFMKANLRYISQISLVDKFYRKHRRIVSSLRKIGVKKEDWPVTDFMALVRYVGTFGFKDGIARFMKLRELDSAQANATKRSVAWGRFPTSDEAKAFAEFLARKYKLRS